MFKIDGSKITLTRGDDAVIELSVFTPDNKPYKVQEGEKARFTVRKRPLYNNSTPPLIEKDFAFATYGEGEGSESKISFERRCYQKLAFHFVSYPDCDSDDC